MYVESKPERGFGMAGGASRIPQKFGSRAQLRRAGAVFEMADMSEFIW